MYIMGKTWVFVFNSDIGAGNSLSEQFYVDWSRIPDKRYKVTFTFMSSAFAVTNTNLVNIFIDLSSSSTIIAQNLNVLTSNRVGYLGTLWWSGSGANNYLRAQTVDNVPIWLDSRPTNTNVKIEMKDNGATQTNPYDTVIGPYTLTLCLEEQD